MDTELKEALRLIQELKGVLVHIRNSAAPSGYVYRVAQENIDKVLKWELDNG
jgi:hypothetical protein